tara:strand:+ start:500 stop:646 length:147 start_codon:yes stop_codon:yes gene_type:complete
MLFINEYNNPKDIRFESFKFTLEVAQKRNLKVINETDQQILLSSSPIN